MNHMNPLCIASSLTPESPILALEPLSNDVLNLQKYIIFQINYATIQLQPLRHMPFMKSMLD